MTTMQQTHEERIFSIAFCTGQAVQMVTPPIDPRDIVEYNDKISRLISGFLVEILDQEPLSQQEVNEIIEPNINKFATMLKEYNQRQLI
jgi:hypothetical protein